MNTSRLDFDRLAATARRLCNERGHPHVEDIDIEQIVNDAVEIVALAPMTDEQVESALDLLIAKDGMTCNSCGAMQDCTPDCEIGRKREIEASAYRGEHSGSVDGVVMNEE